MKNGLILITLLLCSCVSYYEDYEQDYYTNTYTGYSYYDSPLQLRGLGVNDFYMLDNYPGDYLDTQLWSAASDISRLTIYTILQQMTSY